MWFAEVLTFCIGQTLSFVYICFWIRQVNRDRSDNVSKNHWSSFVITAVWALQCRWRPSITLLFIFIVQVIYCTECVTGVAWILRVLILHPSANQGKNVTIADPCFDVLCLNFTYIKWASSPLQVLEIFGETTNIDNCMYIEQQEACDPDRPREYAVYPNLQSCCTQSSKLSVSSETVIGQLLTPLGGLALW